jgi:hypothetical protein
MPDFTTANSDGGPVRPGAARARSRRILAGALAFAALLAPGCGNDNVTLPDANRAVIEVIVEPNPVTGVQNEITLSVSATCTLTIREIGGLGGEIVFVNAAVYEPATGRQVALNYYDGTDLMVFQGGKRLEPGGELVIPQSASYTLSDFSKPADLVVSVQLKDDRTNLIYSSLLVKIQ